MIESKSDYSNYVQARQINTQTAFCFNSGGDEMSGLDAFTLGSRDSRSTGPDGSGSGRTVRQVVRPIVTGARLRPGPTQRRLADRSRGNRVRLKARSISWKMDFVVVV